MSEEKTEAPSQRRLEKARDDGRVAVSREMTMLAGLCAGLTALASQIRPPDIAHWFAVALQRQTFEPAQSAVWAARSIGWAVLPVGLAAAGGAIAATMLQNGFLLHAAALKPDISRISPLSGLKRLFAVQSLVQLLKSLAKLAVLGACLTLAIKRALPLLPAAPNLPPGLLIGRIEAATRGIVFLLLGAQMLIAGADFAWERIHLNKQLRMSLQEVKDEHKESEGNPQIKGRLRQLARARAKRRMMAAVPTASVVITNPTHYAVALAYERGGQGAPRIVAKGADEVAARIRELARQHRVPIVANPPLARALFRIELDTEIPAEHFRAVAEVIAFVWRLRGRKPRL